MTTEQRLDSIERLLGTVAASLQIVAANQTVFQQNMEKLEAATEQNAVAIDRLETMTERNTTAIDRLEAMTERNTTAIDRLEAQIAKTTKNLEDSCTDLIGMINHSIEEGERDRQALVETANAERQTFQAEIRQIWEYLLSQHPNGNGQTS